MTDYGYAEKKAGIAIVELLELPEVGRSKFDNEPLYYTSVGTKTALGLYRTVSRFTEEAMHEEAGGKRNREAK